MRKVLATIAASALMIGAAPSGDSELECLSRNIYHEARGASAVDQKAVGFVTLNRKESRRFPNTICAVVHQPQQFSWVRRQPPISNAAAYDRARRTAEGVLTGNLSDPTQGATYFWNRSVSPPWARRMTVTLRTEVHTYARH